MMLGPPEYIYCPRCSNRKVLYSFISGNTFGASQWSDAYTFAPMLPKLSPVQKCDRCNRYYMIEEGRLTLYKCLKSWILSRHKNRYNSVEIDTGMLSYNELKQAFLILSKRNLSIKNEISLRLEFLHRFNDVFRHKDKENQNFNNCGEQRNEEDFMLHKSNLLRLTMILDRSKANNIPLIAECYREAGEFDECIALLENYNSIRAINMQMKNLILDKARLRNNTVFEINKPI